MSDTLEPSPRLRETIGRDLGTLRRRRARAGAGTGLSIVAPTLAVAVLGSSGRDAVQWGALSLLLVLAMASLALALGIRLPPERTLRPFAGLTFGLTVASLFAFVTPGSARGAGVELWSTGAACLATGALGALALARVTTALGRGALRRHGPTGLLSGLGAGLAALAALQLHCPQDAPVHVLAWHALVPVTASALGAALQGRRATYRPS